MLFSAFDVVVAPAVAYVASSVVVPQYLTHLVGVVVRYGSVVRYGGRHYSRGGVLVVRFVVNDDKDNTNSIMFANNLVFCV